jgi:hypothetical protein
VTEMLQDREASARRLSILVCDDDIYQDRSSPSGWIYKMLAAAEQRVLEGLFDLHPQTTVERAKEAIGRAVPDVSERYDLVIADLFFPDERGEFSDREGTAFADWLLNTHPELPVLVWSGGSDQSVRFFDQHRELFERRALRIISKAEMRDPEPGRAAAGTAIWRLVNLIYETIAQGRRRRDAAFVRLAAAASSLLASLGPSAGHMRASLAGLGLAPEVVELLVRRFGVEGPPDLKDLLGAGFSRATLVFQVAFLAELADRAQVENPQAPVTWMAEQVTGRPGKRALNAYRALVQRLEKEIADTQREPSHA